jgi:hypothetical protein
MTSEVKEMSSFVRRGGRQVIVFVVASAPAVGQVKTLRNLFTIEYEHTCENLNVLH